MCETWGWCLITPLKHISSVIGTTSYQLPLLAKIKPYLSEKSLENANHAFITTSIGIATHFIMVSQKHYSPIYE